LFEGESCGEHDQWTNSYANKMDLEFRPDGRLLVLMRHAGDTETGDSSEATLRAIDPNGNLIDLADDSPCFGLKIDFGGGRQHRPRLSISDDSQVFVIADGIINGAEGGAVAALVLDADLDEFVEPFVPHDDELAVVAQHYFADIVIKGTLVGMTWSRCPFAGSFNCDIDAQFMRFVDHQLQAVGEVQSVNSGDPPGTDNDWPSIAMNENGHSVIVWIDSRISGDYDVFGQLFDGENKVGDNFRISTGEAPQSNRPEVAMKDDGGFMVVWEDGPFQNALGRKYGPNGVPLGPPFLLDGGANAGTQKPHVATNGANYLYTWTSSNDGIEEVFSNLFTPTADDNESPVEASFELEAYPSPFADALTASFTLPRSMEVKVDLYDVLGRHVARLADGLMAAGWHKVGIESIDLPSGLYAVRLVAGHTELTRFVVRAN